MRTEKIRRRNQFRTITVSAFPGAGALAVRGARRRRAAQLDELEAALPPGYTLEIGGEEEEQNKGFANLAIVMGISVVAIFLALVIQFKNAVKPLIVFAAIPFGVGGRAGDAVADGSAVRLHGVPRHHQPDRRHREPRHRALRLHRRDARARASPLEEALLDAGILRLRPVLITVGATVLALFPLAAHGGPLWEPLCYAQIGGLTVATFVTLLLVPVLYAIFVLDLKARQVGCARVGHPHSTGDGTAHPCLNRGD